VKAMHRSRRLELPHPCIACLVAALHCIQAEEYSYMRAFFSTQAIEEHAAVALCLQAGFSFHLRERETAH